MYPQKANIMKKYLLSVVLLVYSVSVFGQNYSALDSLINFGVTDHRYPGASVLIGNEDGIIYKNTYGHYTYDENSSEISAESMFDLASVTKVFATTMCVMKLYDEGKIALDDPVAKYLPNFGAKGKEHITIKNLLVHNSGLPAYYQPNPGEGRDEIFPIIDNLELRYETGKDMVYSCLHFVTLMRVVEKITGMKMWEYLKQEITDPLEMHHTMFTPPESMKNQCVPTEGDIQGHVHDPIAYHLEGLSGNAGLFSTAEDMSKICQLMLNKGELNGKRIFSEQTVELFTKVDDKELSNRALGWETNAYSSSTCGALFAPESFGHNGYTGTMVWIDPTRDTYLIFLTNRVHPNDDTFITDIRRSVGDFTIMMTGGFPPQPQMISVLKDADQNVAISWMNNERLGVIDSTELSIDLGNGFEKYMLSKDDESFVVENVGANEVRVKVINITSGTEGFPSQIYGFRGDDKQVLIIDDVDGLSSKKRARHLITTEYIKALPEDCSYMICNDDLVTQGIVDLKEYPYVIHILADENSSAETFTPKEQKYVKEYLDNGGNYFVNGSEIGWSLEKYAVSEDDTEFYHNVLKAAFVGDKSLRHEVIGEKGSIFEGMTLSFGDQTSIYFVGYADFIQPVEGSSVCLKYDNGTIAAIQGKSGNGKIVHWGFPFETVNGDDVKKEIMKRIFEYFEE